ncbi:T9SS type B sorting domain-containing protein [Chitinophaga polysaccharea]|uniref:T9SS type B sorting domain-containing protein n=1 Tax=Chitinophaga polysaccharea TaxID=1293035 RepID=UPI001455D4C9|nr:gliding motility-associated C-terminal domain-containing protein [Chitinophaga polysaccharea]NLR62082.1 T9SS type B sorting domain-containing protein [Chitinophaga polysaccharea]
MQLSLLRLNQVNQLLPSSNRRMLKRGTAFILFLCGYGLTAAGQSVPIRYIMPGQQVKLSATSVNAPRYQWYRDGMALPGAFQQDYVTATPGKYTVEAYGSGGCISELSDPVIIAEISGRGPDADMQINKTADNGAFKLNSTFNYYLTIANNGPADATAIVVTDKLPPQVSLEILSVPTLGTATYQPGDHTVVWKINDLQASMAASLSIKVKVIATGQITNTATVAAVEQDNVPQNNQSTHQLLVLPLHIPNAITPNGDGINDVFVVSGLEQYPENELTILNRWGNHVFEQKGYTQNWSGKGLNEGTYFYLLRVKDGTGRWQEFKGYITLLKP